MLTLFRDIPFLSDIYRHLRAIRQLFAASTVTPMGFEFVGNQEQLENRYETPVADFLVARHARYRTFVNIGANIGYWPVFLRAVGFSNSILAIEPDKYNFSLLRRNINRNKLRNVDSRRLAIGNSNGFIELYGFGTGISSIKGWAGGHSKRVQRVAIQKFDDLSPALQSPGLVLIDVEGAEFEILRGSDTSFQSDWEFLIELTTFEHQPEGLTINPSFMKSFELLQGRGYRAYGWLPDLREVTPEDLSDLVSQRIFPNIQMYFFSKKGL